MRIWVYVEGESDRLALEALWRKWREDLRNAGWGIHILPLDNKTKYFHKIGARAAEKLLGDEQDLVVGLPDYYPNAPYARTAYAHDTAEALMELQRRLVRDLLQSKGCNADSIMERFYPSALKHDMEMLLLAAHEQLRDRLNTRDRLDNWRHPVEDQNQDMPPKRVVERLFMAKKGRAYRDTRDGMAVLGSVKGLPALLYSESGQLQCPVFKQMLDWVGNKTTIRAY